MARGIENDDRGFDVGRGIYNALVQVQSVWLATSTRQGQEF